jgi:hypothetical protein
MLDSLTPTHLISLGFLPTRPDRCLYVAKYHGEFCYKLVYVDDMLLSCPNRLVLAKLKEDIHRKYPIEDRGPLQFFLNIHFRRD